MALVEHKRNYKEKVIVIIIRTIKTKGTQIGTKSPLPLRRGKVKLTFA